MRALALAFVSLLLCAPVAQAAGHTVEFTGTTLPVSGHRGQSVTARVQLTSAQPLVADQLQPGEWSVLDAAGDPYEVADVKLRAVACHVSAAELSKLPMGDEQRLIDRGRAGQGWYRLASVSPVTLTSGRSLYRRAVRWIVPVSKRRYVYVTFLVQSMSGDLDQKQANMLDLVRNAKVRAQVDR